MNPIWWIVLGVVAIPLLRIVGMLTVSLLLWMFWR